jgi:cobalt-zinc-cadmium efflux system membrane fusion protein
VAEQAGIRVTAAGPGTIRDEHDVQGLLTPIEGRHARLAARFPGPIRSVSVGVGDTVRTGQTLATVESNVSLSAYAIASPIDGVVLGRAAAVGEMAGETPLFEVADLSALWVDLHLFGSDAQHITPGLPVEVTRLSDGVSARTTLDRVLPATATASQSTVARATLSNADGLWRPGAAVRARVTVAEDAVPLMVPLAALQRFRDWDVVFVRIGEEYEIRPLALGRRDAVNAEVLDGLKVGDPIVVEQSYLVKADIEKAGASHDH